MNKTAIAGGVVNLYYCWVDCIGRAGFWGGSGFVDNSGVELFYPKCWL
jgi:hypothetical protein